MDLIVTGMVAFFLAGFVKGVVGFGFPIIVLVILTLTIGLFEALAILIVPTLVTNIWQALSGPYLSAVLQRMWLYFVCSAVGILIASRFLTVVNVELLTGLLGGVLLFFALTRLLNFHITVDRAKEPLLSVVLGTVNGGLTGFTGSFMVPSVLYMQALGFSKDMLVQAMGMFFAISTLMLTISLGTNSLLGGDSLKLSVVALIPSFTGIYLGRWARKQVDELQFQKIFLSALLVLGSYLLWRSVIAFP
ncbi:MAG: sulfite exporter TauE/SafE family protein [Woeseiaceae bacterium]